jgi:sensor histidine kinase regulating citrate/malate metabolism
VRAIIKLTVTALVCLVVAQLASVFTDLQAISRKTQLNEQFRAKQAQAMRQCAATKDPVEQALVRRDLASDYQEFISELHSLGTASEPPLLSLCSD